jgi:hypothetical protein
MYITPVLSTQCPKIVPAHYTIEVSPHFAVSQRGGSIACMPALCWRVVIFHNCQRVTNLLGAVHQDCSCW